MDGFFRILKKAVSELICTRLYTHSLIYFCVHYFLQSYLSPEIVRNCYLVGLADLDGSQSYVQDVQAKYMNDLLSIGVAGFRVDAAKHMWVADIEALQAKLNDVNGGGRPYFYMEVIDQCK